METLKNQRVKFAFSGAVTGFVTGFFGAGGGMLLIPLLTKLCRVEDKQAFATSVAVVLPLCIAGLAVYALQGNVSLQGAWPYLLGGALGGVIGGLLFKKTSAVFLHKALGLFILWGGFRLVTG